jgi:hypothetical protein
MYNIDFLSINTLLLNETGTYNKYYNRPYEVNPDTDNLNRLEATVQNCVATGGASLNTISANELAHNNPGLVKPSVIPKAEVHIPNGWNEHRVRFTMPVEIHRAGAIMIYYFQGYSEYFDPSLTGKLDPNMKFFINSVLAVSRTPSPDGYGFRDIIIDNNLLMYDPNKIVGEASYTNPVDNLLGSEYLIRPIDIFSGADSAISYGAVASDYGLQNQPIADTRALVTTDPKASKRSNNLSSQYVSNIVNAWARASDLTEFGSSNTDKITAARGNAVEDNLANNPFVNLLGSIHGYSSIAYFTINDLMQIDPSMVSRIDQTINDTGNITPVHQEGMTQDWASTDYETQIATIVANAIPALMSEYLITRIAFSITNAGAGGVPVTAITDGASIVDADMSPYFEKFKFRLESEVMKELTNSGMFIVDLHVIADIYKDMWIKVSFNGGPLIDYVVPVYCDGLLAPVTVKGQDNFYSVVNDFETMINVIDSAT